MPHFIVALSGWNPAAQIGLPNPGCGFSDFADMAEHAPSHVEDNRRAEQHDEQPKAEKAEAKRPQHPQFISFRKSEINVAPIFQANRGHPKGMIESFDIQVVRHVGNKFTCANGSQVRLPVTSTNPKFQSSVVSGLEKEDRVVLIATGEQFVRHLSTCKFCDFSHYPTVESVLWRSPGYIAEDSHLSREPRVAPPLNVVCHEAMKHRKNQHCPDGKCQSCPQRDTPCGAMHNGISGL